MTVIWGFSDNDIMTAGYTINFVRWNGSSWGSMPATPVPGLGGSRFIHLSYEGNFAQDQSYRRR